MDRGCTNAEGVTRVSDLIGRFLSFEERLGRGLVKFGYYLAIGFLVIWTVFALFKYLFSWQIGAFFLVPFQFIGLVIALRVTSETLLSILSIDENKPHGASDGFEAGITPSPAPSTTMHETRAPAPEETPAAPTANDANGDSDDASDDDRPSATDGLR